MFVTKWFELDPDIGAPVVPEYSDPAMADKVVHFVGRQRGNTVLPGAVRHLSAEQRLAQILITGQLLAFPVYGSASMPVVSASDLSAAELETAFARGLNRRGRLDPWAIVLDREMMWQAGMRPVVYAESARFAEIRDALAGIYGQAGPALVVRTEMRTDDWTAEREWRFCFAPPPPVIIQIGDPLPPPPPLMALSLGSAVRAVIVGRQGWVPGPPQPQPPSNLPERWLWDEQNRRLVHDGRIPLW